MNIDNSPHKGMVVVWNSPLLVFMDPILGWGIKGISLVWFKMGCVKMHLWMMYCVKPHSTLDLRWDSIISSNQYSCHH